MAIDIRDYEKYSGRKGDPNMRRGEVLAKNARAKQERDAMPKGVSGGFRMMLMPGIFAQLFNWIRNIGRYKGD